MDNLTKETRKTLPYGKSRATAYYALALPLDDGFPGWHLECTAMSKIFRQSF
jgi:cysteinyl-tRNA synthetase